MSFPANLAQSTSTSPPDLPLWIASPDRPDDIVLREVDWSFFVHFVVHTRKDEIPTALHGLQHISATPYTTGSRFFPTYVKTCYRFSEDNAKTIHNRYYSIDEIKRVENVPGLEFKRTREGLERVNGLVNQWDAARKQHQ